ncbi:MAG: tRNA pseudouridine(55) synthase TruB [Pelagibacterales bacterium]|nr:tRNA pseudouridine(55) synthase TruB [Pelagibacterales bacterium]
MLNGLLLIDKPKNISSNNSLKIIKKKLSIKKAGIVGILDPLATGMLPVVLGEATKLAQYVESYEKEYLVLCRLGSTSTTGDEEGVIKEFSSNHLRTLSKASISSTLKSFVGRQEQIPPMFSALKVNGTKLYTLARKGISIERKPRIITISNIELIDYNNRELIIKVVCSKGTYIRTLVEQIGDNLNIGAYTKNLRRLRVGEFKEQDMINLDDISSNINHNSGCFININNIVRGLESFQLDVDDEAKIRLGQSIQKKSDSNNCQVIMKNYEKNIIGIGFIKNNYIKPKRLLNFKE